MANRQPGFLGLQPVFLGLDVGTTGVRGICIAGDGEIVASARENARTSDRNRLRAPSLWKHRLSGVFGALGRQIDLASVASVSVGGQSGTVLLCDNEGTPLLDASLLYNDAPKPATIDNLTALLGVCPPTLGRAFELWTSAGRPANFHLLHQADWIAGLMSGLFDQSDEHNALKTGHDPAKKRWVFDPARLPFSKSALPDVSAPGSLIGHASTAFSAEAGLSPDCRIVGGTTDGMAGFIATSGLDDLAPGTAVTSLGTTLIIKIVSPRYIEAPRQGIYSHALRNVWVAGGASNTGAGALLEHFTTDQLAELSRTIDPDISSPLDYYPLVTKGERFPVCDAELTSRTEPRPADDGAFLAGLLESIARIEKQAFDALDHLGAPYPETVVTVGGGAVNETWRKIRERVLGTRVVTAQRTDAAYGAAVLAQMGCKIP